jgi:hypothetical protein
MISSSERARLTEQYKDQPIHAAAALIKSVICLLLIAGIAVIGAQRDVGDNAAQLQTQAMRDRS